jgi:hypothetical protein
METGQKLAGDNIYIYLNLVQLRRKSYDVWKWLVTKEIRYVNEKQFKIVCIHLTVECTKSDNNAPWYGSGKSRDDRNGIWLETQANKQSTNVSNKSS